MNTQQPANIPDSTSTSPENSTLFGDVLDTTPYEKSLKTARIYLYIIAALQVGMGVYEYSTTDDHQLALVAGLIDVGIGLVFIGMALWSYKKPLPAFITALATYVVLHATFMVIEPSNIWKGILLKILVVVALVKAIKDAQEVKKLRESVA